MLTRIFISPDDSLPGQRRLRAGWRVLGQFIIMTAIGLAVTLMIGWLALLVPTLSSYGFLAAQIGSFIAINSSVILARRLLDRRSMISLGLQTGRNSVKDLLVGFLIAGVMMLAIYFIQRAAGWLTFQGFVWQTISVQQTVLATLTFLILFIIVGWQEELLFRGYLLQNTAEGLNLFWGVLISSLFFSLGHLSNPNMGWMPVLGLLLAGLFLAYAYVRTRQLWLPIGLHIGWNFFESTVLGFPVSGLNLFRLIEQSINGPDWFTGGAFGPEAGLVLLPALALGTILVYYYTGLEPK